MRKFGYVQQVVEDFYQSGKDVVVVSILPGTYANINSARCAYRSAIKKLNYNNITVRIINGDMYLIRVRNPNWTAKNHDRVCFDCVHRYPSKECATCSMLSNYVSKHLRNAADKKGD